MSRQRTRQAVLTISAILFPVTFYYLSPAVILMGASEGIVTGSFIVFGLLFFGSLFFGRAFCGWICPGGAIGEGMCRIRDRRVTRRWVSWIKYAIWVPWLALIAALAVRAGGLTRAEFTYQTWHGISVSSWNALFVFAIVVTLIASLTLLVGRRGFCHTACWMAPFMILGRALRDRLRLPGLRLQVHASDCISCGACTRTCPMSLDVQAMVKHEAMTATECILCARCADGCPKNVISLRFCGASDCWHDNSPQ
ncbi:4Fe-4S binding protein [Candidatus Bipolaricaulota bacterium]|nr:4Fe-4S binding protein [Candidatus Bipolaricaulota bacterium]TFH10252.1 MAG: 4Fe-4S binding protein [Candidatus Atribacteria bacterium]